MLVFVMEVFDYKGLWRLFIP